MIYKSKAEAFFSLLPSPSLSFPLLSSPLLFSPFFLGFCCALQAKTISMPSGLSHWQNVFQVIPHFPIPASLLPSPIPIVFYFMRLLRQVKAFAGTQPQFPPLPSPAHVPALRHFFVLYGFYDFSISFATSLSLSHPLSFSPSTANFCPSFARLAYQFHR